MYFLNEIQHRRIICRFWLLIYYVKEYFLVNVFQKIEATRLS